MIIDHPLPLVTVGSRRYQDGCAERSQSGCISKVIRNQNGCITHSGKRNHSSFFAAILGAFPSQLQPF